MAFTGVLLREKIAIRMDGRGASRDNVIVERLWRSTKYEEVYLRAYAAVSEARRSIGRYPSFLKHPQATFEPGRKVPDHAHFDKLLVKVGA